MDTAPGHHDIDVKAPATAAERDQIAWPQLDRIRKTRHLHYYRPHAGYPSAPSSKAAIRTVLTVNQAAVSAKGHPVSLLAYR